MSLLTPGAGHPLILNVPVSTYGVVGAMRPSWSAAVAVTSLNVEPGVYCPSIASSFSAPLCCSAAKLAAEIPPTHSLRS